MTTTTEQTDLFPGLFPEPPKVEMPPRHRAVYTHSGATICWHVPGTRCWAHDDDVRYLRWGRTRSGRRWFWAAGDLDVEDTEHGWADTQTSAITAAKMAVTRLGRGEEAIARMNHGYAAQALKEINKAKRKARPASGDTGTEQVRYLYATAESWDDGRVVGERVIKFPITKITPKRIFYVRSGDGDDAVIGYVDRQRIQDKGSVYNTGAGGWWAPDARLYLEPPDLTLDHAPELSLAELKKAMADAHPDRGGSNEAFIKARAEYQRARSRGATR
jgi:hypothetical protein